MMQKKTNSEHKLRQFQSGETVQIAGAGPAGLAAAITLAKEGVAVQVHEARNEVGFRFQGDFQGLENWTTEQDVLQWMQEHGLTTEFEILPGRQGTIFDDRGKPYEMSSQKPFFYMLERGPGAGSLDTALLNQARALGVEIIFNSRIKHIESSGVLAIGPKAADAIAVGYHFETDMDNGFWAICDDNLAPKGYAYLLVMNGRGTIKSCMFSGFKQEQLYVKRTVAAFERLVGLKMINPQPHGGVGNFHIPLTAIHGGHPIVGEQAGFQDTLWGFGMRHAMASGILAAQSIMAGSNYDDLWKKAFADQLKASIVNRAIFGLLGNRGYRLFLHLLSSTPDPRMSLSKHYGLSRLKQLLLPWAKWRYRSQRKDKSCDHIDCSCVWCRCG
jgi:flavin-dependent dehydrogenase